VEKARAAFQEARASGVTRKELEPLAERLVRAHEGVERFLERQPELSRLDG